MASPIYMMEIYNRVLPTQSMPTLYVLTALAAGLILVSALLEIIRSRLLVRVSARLDRQLNDRILAATFVGALGSTNGGTQPLRDLDTVRQFIGGSGTLVFFDIPWTPLLILVIFLCHPLLGLITTGGALVLFLLAILNDVTTRGPLEQANRQSLDQLGFVGGSLRNAEAVHAMGMFASLCRRRAPAQTLLLRFQSVASDRAGVLTAVSKAFRQLLQTAILGAAAYLALNNQISAGEIVAVSLISGRALAPLETAIGTWKQFLAARSAYTRVASLLSRIPAPMRRTSLPRPTGAVEMHRLVATVPGGVVPILKNVELRIAAGSITGIVGPSGAGKSTLLRVLVGVWQPMAGNVRLDGFDLSSWNRDELGAQIGYLPQDVELLQGTVAENIARFGDCDSSAIVAAAQRAGAHEMIGRLPQGYDTPIGPSGVTLSGGQRQRVGLARAMFGHPALVVLDEPNANLDQNGECALNEALVLLRQEGITVVLTTHKASLLDLTDSIVVVEDGLIVAHGSRQDVMRRLNQAAPAPRQLVA